MFVLKSELMMDRPYLPEQVSANLSRDWPDSRGIWMNDNKTLIGFINREDHLMLCTVEIFNENTMFIYI